MILVKPAKFTMTPANWIYLIISTISLFQNFSECNCLWSSLFLNADITFIFTPECSKLLDENRDFPYFQKLRAGNPYTPQRQIILCRTTSAFNSSNGINPLRRYAYLGTEKSPRPKAIFVPVDATTGYNQASTNLKCEYLIKDSSLVLRQEYIFGYTLLHRDGACFKYAAQIIGTAKLFLFQEGINSSLLIPCLTCDPKIFIQVERFLLSGVRRAWDLENTNMHKYFAFLSNFVRVKCSLHYREFLNVFNNYCLIQEIADKHNLTLLNYVDNDHVFFSSKSIGVLFIIELGMPNSDYLTYIIRYCAINFITVTDYPSPAGGVETFMSPLDLGSWICLLISAIAVAGFLASLVIADGSLWTAYIPLIADKLVTIICLLLGQVGDSSGKPYRTGKVAILLVVLWLFGNLILMGNFYQGSIYSCLTVQFPPEVPRSVGDLENWKIPMITMDSFIRANDLPPISLLLDDIIPSLLFKNSDKPEFTHFLKNVQGKILPAWEYPGTTLSYESEKVGYPKTVILIKQDARELVRTIGNLLTKRRYVMNRGDSPFQFSVAGFGSKHLYSSFFMNDCGRMAESGLDTSYAVKLRKTLFFSADNTVIIWNFLKILSA